MPRVVLSVQYDGRDWLGWQSQPGGRTVQDTLEQAIGQFTAGPVRVHAAGRTDTGVHATAQVVHFDCDVERPLTAWVRGVNRYLPASIAVRAAGFAAEDFHARFSAVSRSYAYVLYSHPVRAPHLSGRAGWTHRPLNDDAMKQSAQVLLGEHDFSAFRSAECQAKSPIKTLHQADLTRRGDVLVFRFRANAFLHHMVRNLVGSLVAVGRGSEAPDFLQRVLDSKDRALCAPTFMADGLYLTHVGYPDGHLPVALDGLESAFPGLLP